MPTWQSSMSPTTARSPTGWRQTSVRSRFSKAGWQNQDRTERMRMLERGKGRVDCPYRSRARTVEKARLDLRKLTSYEFPPIDGGFKRGDLSEPNSVAIIVPVPNASSVLTARV